MNIKIHELLLKHRDFFITQGQPEWKKCVLTIDVKHGKMSMEFGYD